MTRVRAGTGEEPGMIESMGQFIGVGLGVVGLSFIAGAQSKKGDDGDYSDEAVSAPKPKSSTSSVREQAVDAEADDRGRRRGR
jgi:hypothetical protein